MPVPKKRTTKSAKGQRRSHHSLSATALVTEKTSGILVPRRLVKAAKLGLARVKKV